MSELQSLYIKARVRSRPGENFEDVQTRHNFTSLQIIKTFGDPPKWRIEKPQRVVVMDGRESLLLITGDEGAMAARGGPDNGFVMWLKPLLDPRSLMEHEQHLAEQEGSRVVIERVTSDSGSSELLLTVEATAQGDFSQSDLGRNASIQSSDNRRIYRFDPETRLLKGLQVYMHTPDGDVLVFETTRIEYDKAVSPETFVLDLPANVGWYQLPEQPAAQPAEQPDTPEQAARQFLEALAASDWDTVQSFVPITPLPDWIKSYGGIEIISIGEAVQSGLYEGWFVPYEIRLPSGRIRKLHLAIRNDNPAHRYIWDGGL